MLENSGESRGHKPTKLKKKAPAKPPAAMLDVLPTKKGEKPKPYRPPVAKKVVRKAAAQRKQRQTEVKDTKGDADMRRGDKLKQSDAYIKSLRDANHARQKPVAPKGGGLHVDVQNIDANVRPLMQARTDIPRSDAELRKFLKTGEGPTRKPTGITRSPVGTTLHAPGLRLMRESTRPLHGSAATAKALVEHKGVGEALKEGGDAFLHNKNVTYSNVLKSAGVKNRTVRAVGGFVGDMVFDPTTGARITRLAPKTAFERKASEAEAKAAKATGKGRVRKAAKETAKASKAHAKAATASDTRGFQVGYDAKIPFGPRVTAMSSGKASAKVGKKLRGAGDKIHGSRPVQTVEALFNPTARKAGETAAERDARVYAERKKRARTNEAERHAHRRGTAHARAAKGVDQPEMIAAVEGAAKKPLTATKVVKRKTAAHKAVPKAKRAVQTAQRKAAKEMGRAQFETAQATRNTIGEVKALGKLHEADLLGRDLKPLEAEAVAAVNAVKKAAGARSAATRELANARKNLRNATTGAPKLYTDAERTAARERVDKAQAAVADAKDTYTIASRKLDVVAELHAGHAAGGRASSPLKRVDRQNPTTLRRLEKARGNLAAAEATYATAKETAKGAPKYESYLTDAKTGQRYTDFKATAPKVTISGLPPKAQKLAQATQKELADLKATQQKAGVLEGERPDYYPHRLIPEPRTVKIGRKGRPAKNAYAKTRNDPRPIAEQNAERAAQGKGPLFSTDHGTVMADYVGRAKRAEADSQYLKDVKATGKPLNASNWAKRRPTDDLYEITPTGFKEVRKPNGKALDDHEVQHLINSNADVTILPKSVGDAELGARTARSESVKKALSLVNKPMQVFKTAATVMNVPFYQERNFMDDSFRAWASGATAASYKDSVRLVKDQALLERRETTKVAPAAVKGDITVAGKKMPRDEFLREAREDGALRTGFFAGSDLLEGSIKPAVGVRRIQPINKIREYSQNFEDVPKLAAYKAARDRGLSRQEAAAHVRVYMFDYDEITDFERAVRATVIPFYTYVKKNTLLQARLFVSQPGKPAAVEKLIEEASKWGADDPRYKASLARIMPLLQQAQKEGLVSQKEINGLKSGDFHGLLNDNDQRGFPFMGPGGKLIYMPLGITDLNRIPFATSWDAIKKMPGQQFDLAMSLIGPQKLPLELAQNYSFFFRDAIYRSAKNPQAERWVPAPGWASKAGIPTVKQQVDGKVVDAWPAWVDYSIRSLGPQLGMAANVGNPVQNQRGQSLKDMLLKQASGLRSANFEDRMLAGIQARASERLGKINVEIADRGDIPAGKGRSSDGFFYSAGYQKLIDEQKTLQDLLKTVRETRLKVKQPDTLRLSRRPLPPDQQILQDVKKQQESVSPDKILQQIAREQAKQNIIAGP